MKNKRQPNKSSAAVWVIILLVIMIYNFAGDLAGDFDPDVLVPVFIGIAFTAFIVVIINVVSKAKLGKTDAKKQTSVPLNRPFPQPTALKTKQPSRVFQHKDEAEEALTCAHHTGKEKYFQQAEGFYRNGLIDRAEYKVLREKYEKLEIPEDYH